MDDHSATDQGLRSAPDRADGQVDGPTDGRPQAVRLLDAIPELERAVPADDRPLARRAMLAPRRSLAAGRIAPPLSTAGTHPFAFFILGGILLKDTHLDGRAAVEIFGEGDLLPIALDTAAASAPLTSEYVVHAPATVAVLDDRFRLVARRWPGLHDIVAAGLTRQVDRASMYLAILHLPRVEDRLAMLFADLADRWGRVTHDGVVIDVPLTHDLLGRLVGSRRPTVTLALRAFAAEGVLTRMGDRAWLLSRAWLRELQAAGPATASRQHAGARPHEG